MWSSVARFDARAFRDGLMYPGYIHWMFSLSLNNSKIILCEL